MTKATGFRLAFLLVTAAAASAYVLFANTGRPDATAIAGALTLDWEDLRPAGTDPYANADFLMGEDAKVLAEADIPEGADSPIPEGAEAVETVEDATEDATEGTDEAAETTDEQGNDMDPDGYGPQGNGRVADVTEEPSAAGTDTVAANKSPAEGDTAATVASPAAEEGTTATVEPPAVEEDAIATVEPPAAEEDTTVTTVIENGETVSRTVTTSDEEAATETADASDDASDGKPSWGEVGEVSPAPPAGDDGTVGPNGEVALGNGGPGGGMTVPDGSMGVGVIDRTFGSIPGFDEEPGETPTFAPKPENVAPAPVRPELDGKRVAIAGYMTPLEHDGTNVRRFLLVPYVGACIHVPPPPSNQIVLVEIEGTVPLMEMWEPFTAVGELKVESKTTQLADVGYTMKLERIAPYVEQPTDTSALPADDVGDRG